MKKLCTFRSLGVALGCAALTLIGVAADDPPRTIPIDGTFGTTFKLIPITEGVFDTPIEGVGNVRGLGPCTIVIAQTADFRNNPPTLDSEWVMTFADSDQLNVVSQGTGTPHESNPAFIKLDGEGIITGGTGRFENATGVLRFPGVAHTDTPPGVFPAEGHGTFALEGFVRLSGD
ncbi:MAG: hypothetical protein L0Y58_04270 [Verrucomicrobia subdivision 3 bacterium]|nr:hypothetical protein [Limisphaerales bacterium]